MTLPLRPEDPRSLGRYELIGRLGEGGMGVVFLGRDPWERLAAVKVIRAEHARDEGFRARFRSEVNRVREVPPFCTAEILDADPDHETPYLVVEYVDGPSLAEVIRTQGPLKGGSLHSIAVGVASALAAIHSAGIVHRDLKPANVLLALGSPKVIDFGIAKALEATSHHTEAQEMVGTLSYMSPERFSPDTDRNLTPAADVFAWGAVVAYAATGRNPFTADSPVATAGRILTQPPNLTGMEPGLARIVERALSKDPAHRPTARQLLLELTTGPTPPSAIPHDVLQAATAARDALPSRPPEPRSSHPTPHPARRRWPVIGAATATVLLLTLGGVWAGTRLQPQPAPLATDATRSLSPPPPSFPVSPSPTAGPLAKELADPLTAPGPWSPFASSAGSCDFDDGLVVRTRSFVQCENGPDQVFEGDTRIDVRAELSRDACMITWFRLSADGENSYYAMVCADYVAVHFEEDGALGHSDYNNVREGTLTRLKIEQSGWHRIRVDVVANIATVSVDGKQVLTSDLSLGRKSGPRHTSGKVTFGLSGQGDDPGVTLTLRDARITTT